MTSAAPDARHLLIMNYTLFYKTALTTGCQTRQRPFNVLCSTFKVRTGETKGERDKEEGESVDAKMRISVDAGKDRSSGGGKNVQRSMFNVQG